MKYMAALAVLILALAPLAQAETWEEFQKRTAIEEEPTVLLKGGPKTITKDIIIEGLKRDCQFTFQSDSLLFQYGSSQLKPESMPNIDSVAAALKDAVKDQDLAQIKVYYVDGHTCSIGTEENNCRLSRMRTKTVVNELVQRGVPQEMLVPRGFGKGYPAHSNDTEPNRALNRRVVLKGDCGSATAVETEVPCVGVPEDQVRTPSSATSEAASVPLTESPVDATTSEEKSPGSKRILPPDFKPVTSSDGGRIVKEPVGTAKPLPPGFKPAK
jgi:outer membrane protein OmpA-like peptidoglycan-associated protein